jgi:hypothetical protein
VYFKIAFPMMYPEHPALSLERHAVSWTWCFAIALWFVAVFWQKTAHGAENIEIGVSCKVAGKTEDGLDTQVCTELISVLKQAYPKFAFVLNLAKGQPSIKIVLQNATRSSLGLQLKWRTASGRVSEGKLLSVVSMDKVMDLSHRNSLYHRALAETPMPKLIGQE